MSDPEQHFLSVLPLIERVIASICRRHCCFGPDAEDFGSTVKLKLIDDDYAVLRKFRSQSQLATYLTVVVTNQFRDFRIRRWGKWRPSARARRLGDVAVRLEQLRFRDGFTQDQAAEVLKDRLGDDAPTREELDKIAAELPHRVRRRFESEEGLESLPDSEQADDRVVRGEKERVLARAKAALAETIADLPEEDRLILKMHYEDGFPLSRIARQLRINQRRLYSRREKLLKALRQALEAAGVDGGELEDVLGGD